MSLLLLFGGAGQAETNEDYFRRHLNDVVVEDAIVAISLPSAQALSSDTYGLEDGSGGYMLEDGSGDLLLEESIDFDYFRRYLNDIE